MEALSKDVKGIADKLDTHALTIERWKGRAEGSKATAMLIGSVFGSLFGAIVTWFAEKR